MYAYINSVLASYCDLMNFTVRPLKPFEVDDVVRLWRRLAEDPSASGATLIVDDENTGRFKEFLKGLSRDDENQVLVSEIDGKIVGFIMFAKQARSMLRLRHSHAMITDLYVDEEHRRHGIAYMMVKGCLDYLRSRNIEHVRVNVVANNTPARELYKKLGFTDDMITMNKPLELKDRA